MRGPRTGKGKVNKGEREKEEMGGGRNNVLRKLKEHTLNSTSSCVAHNTTPSVLQCG